MGYNIHLEKFEGPLDLLLYFIRRDELDIYDIPISKITEDFINTINEWKRLNMVIAGEFIVMASTLMRIKAKMMIPREQIDEDGDNIDPRTELMHRLIDYKRFRKAADILTLYPITIKIGEITSKIIAGIKKIPGIPIDSIH